MEQLHARCYAVLAEGPPASAGEVAKRMPVSRPQVYKALRELAEAGYATASAGRPVRYSAVPVTELFDKLRSAARQRLLEIDLLEPAVRATVAQSATTAPQHSVLNILPRRDLIVDRTR